MKKFLILLVCFNLLADDSAVHLNAGQQAPFEGILLTIDKAQETRVKLLERDQFELLNQSLTKSIGIYKTNQDILVDQNNKLATTSYRANEVNYVRDVLIFLAGALVTTGILYGVKKVSQ